MNCVLIHMTRHTNFGPATLRVDYSLVANNTFIESIKWLACKIEYFTTNTSWWHNKTMRTTLDLQALGAMKMMKNWSNSKKKTVFSFKWLRLKISSGKWWPRCVRCLLTHWGRATHLCVCKLPIVGSDNGLWPDRRQAIIWTNDGLLLIGPLGTKCI